MKVEVGDFIKILLETFPPDPKELEPKDPIELIIKFILAGQNASEKVVNEAYKNLTSRFKSWEEVLNAPDWKVAEAIRVAGYSNKKTNYIKQFLRFVAKHNWDLSWIKDLDPKEAIEVLKQIKGIPSRSIRYILAFSFDMPVFPVDPHIKRVIRRLGILGNNATEEMISEYFESIEGVPHKELYLALKEHANKICAARKPKCLMCPISDLCYSVSPSVEYLKGTRRIRL